MFATPFLKRRERAETFPELPADFPRLRKPSRLKYPAINKSIG
jgi:hypothetical protein